MTKVVINIRYGGFGLSARALATLAERIPNFDQYELRRDNPVLVAVVEALGPEADGDYAQLEIVELEPGTRYRIREYDGSEHIERESDIQWSVA